jgi:transposase-like protein
MAQALQLLFNEAMKLERTAFLGAQPFERTPTRRGQANGFKPKTVQTRLGPLELRVPQTRDASLYPSALERGQRSERALKLAIAEMYVQVAALPVPSGAEPAGLCAAEPQPGRCQHGPARRV